MLLTSSCFACSWDPILHVCGGCRIPRFVLFVVGGMIPAMASGGCRRDEEAFGLRIIRGVEKFEPRERERMGEASKGWWWPPEGYRGLNPSPCLPMTKIGMMPLF